MKIVTQRIYDHESVEGYRILIDRIWPRGISKQDAGLDDWWKDFAPSTELRKWFNHKEEKWPEFREKYLKELQEISDQVKQALQKTRQPVVLLYGAKTREYNNAIVMKEFLERL